jgi:hypothetical protein
MRGSAGDYLTFQGFTSGTIDLDDVSGTLANGLNAATFRGYFRATP